MNGKNQIQMKSALTENRCTRTNVIHKEMNNFACMWSSSSNGGSQITAH